MRSRNFCNNDTQRRLVKTRWFGHLDSNYKLASTLLNRCLGKVDLVSPTKNKCGEIEKKPSLDIYSLAASLYYAVTGELPEASLNRRLYCMALVSPQEHITSMSDRLNQAILTGMELEPENRPQIMQEWLKMLALRLASLSNISSIRENVKLMKKYLGAK